MCGIDDKNLRGSARHYEVQRGALKGNSYGGMWCPILLVALTCFLLSGCIGGSVPQEQILRIAHETSKASGASEEAGGFSGPIIVMEDMDSFPALDRSAVMVAAGNVLTPSTRWYWEGAPAAITSASIAARLQEERSYTIVWPMRNRLEHQAMLTGRVEEFEASSADKDMHIALRMSLWTPRGGKLLLTRIVRASRPLAAVSAEGIARAASLCMTDITGEIALWLRTDGITAIKAAQ